MENEKDLQETSNDKIEVKSEEQVEETVANEGTTDEAKDTTEEVDTQAEETVEIKGEPTEVEAIDSDELGTEEEAPVESTPVAEEEVKSEVEETIEIKEEPTSTEATVAGEDTPVEAAPVKKEEVVAKEEAQGDAQEETAEVEESPSKVAPVTDKSTDNEASEAPAAESKPEEAPSASDHDHHDHDEHDDHHEHEEHIDYSQHTKQELLNDVAKLSHDDNVRKADRELKEIIPFFNEFAKKERQEALAKFKADGGEAADFDYKDDEAEKFEEYVKIIKERKSSYFHNLEKEKETNLVRKNDILEKLRLIVDGEESTTSINTLKEIQEEWKEIGPVPGQHNRTLWANYNALIDRFYDNRSIYFELKELDRKKNLDSKLELCDRAEDLAKIEDIHEATKQLNELHEEFKHIGPIPKDDQEPVWQRFKAASDKVYARRREFVETLKVSLKENLDKKLLLVDEVKPFESFNSDRINEWNAKTKEILEVQKKWEAIGGIPRDKAKSVNKNFWGPFKHFFHNKGQFFKTLEGKREENLELKKQLVEKAESLKDSTDWNATADALKKLQQEWRNVGPVPEKFRNQIFEQFKAACDHFFNMKRGHDQESEKEFYVNLQKKEEICDKLDAIAKTKKVNADEVYDLLDEFADIGFVPRRDIKKIKAKYDAAVKNVIANADNLDEDEKEDLRISVQVNKLKSGPNANRKIHRKEHSIKRKITNLENDINTWTNNMQFFANSKNADKLKADFEEKLEKAQEELEHLKRELQVLHQA